MNISMLKQILLLKMRSFLAIAILLAVALALQLFINLYQSPRVEKLHTEWANLRAQEGRGAALQDRETLYQNGRSDLAKFREKIYPKSQFARFIGELYEMASKNGLELTSITYKPTIAKEEHLLNYTLALSVSGKYPQLKRFIYDLGSGSSNLLVIDSIAISATEGVSETANLQLSITSWFKMEAQ